MKKPACMHYLMRTGSGLAVALSLATLAMAQSQAGTGTVPAASDDTGPVIDDRLTFLSLAPITGTICQHIPRQLSAKAGCIWTVAGMRIPFAGTGASRHLSRLPAIARRTSLKMTRIGRFSMQSRV